MIDDFGQGLAQFDQLKGSLDIYLWCGTTARRAKQTFTALIYIPQYVCIILCSEVSAV